MSKSGLRERQKNNRKQRILEAAKIRFQADGYAAVTVEAIANDAEVSSVTVYKYYGSKAGLLLALVSESDELLIEQLQAMIDSRPEVLTDAVASFGQILRQHAMSYLSKQTWREVISASIQEGSREFGRTYVALDRVLIELMQALIRTFQTRGLISTAVDCAELGNTMFSLQNIRFFQFIADDEITDLDIDNILRSDLNALKQVFSTAE